MIPRRFFWLLDVAVTTFAICLAYALWPTLHEAANRFTFSWVPEVFRPAPVTQALPGFNSLLRLVVLGCGVVIVVFELGGTYRSLLQQSRARLIVNATVAALAAGGFITLFLFLEKSGGWSRLFLVSFILFSGVALALLRLSLRSYLEMRRQAGFYRKNVLLIGPSNVRWLADYFTENVASNEYTVTGYLAVSDLDDDDSGVPRMGVIADLPQVLISHPVDEVIAVQPNGSAQWMPGVVETCDALGILLRIVPEGLLFGKTRTLKALYPLQVLHLPAVVLAPPHFDSDALFFKRAFDIVVSTTLLVLLSPLFAIIAIAIKLSDRHADVFYRWNVVGRNGVRFTGFKFTTMFADADQRRTALLGQNEMSGPVFKIKNDPRVTPLGRFLRKYSINELPQLWSVLKGDMSLVGPRPAFPHELEAYGFWHKRKLSIRPGITCLWQVRGRNRISNFDDWVKMDLEYIDNWSLWLDLKILVRTAWAVVAGTGS